MVRNEAVDLDSVYRNCRVSRMCAVFVPLFSTAEELLMALLIMCFCLFQHLLKKKTMQRHFPAAGVSSKDNGA